MQTYEYTLYSVQTAKWDGLLQIRGRVQMKLGVISPTRSNHGSIGTSPMKRTETFT